MTLRKSFSLAPTAETSVYSPELSPCTRLIIAAGNNDVEEIKRMQKAGADINHTETITLGSGTLRIGSDGNTSQPESETSALMVALHNGAFDAALYLAREGADGTRGRKDPICGAEQKPLDFLLTDHVREKAKEIPSVEAFFADVRDEAAVEQRQKNYQTDLFTPEQRLRICEALVSNAENPADLASEATLDNAIMWARAEMIHKLALIGLKIEDEHFVQAANPIHRPDQAIKIMATILPYVGGVNATNSSQKNAGHVAAGVGNLEAFKWLEERGLDPNAESTGLRTKTYAHAAVFDRPKSEDRQVAFAQHLADQGYELEGEKSHEHHAGTPTDMAFDEGNTAAGLVYLKAGTTLKPKHLVQALKAQHYKVSQTAIENLLTLVDMFSEREMLSQETATAAYTEMLEKISWSEKNAPIYAPIAIALTGKGFGLGKISLQDEKMKEAARLLLSAMEEAPEPAQPVLQNAVTPPPPSL